MNSTFKSYPVSLIYGTINVSGDKSISHRAIILAAIANGISTIKGLLQAEDCLHTLNIFKNFGIKIETHKDITFISGVGKYGLKSSGETIYCGNSGTTMRLLTGLLVAQNFDSILTGDESLSKRPMQRVALPLNAMGAKVITTNNNAPIKIIGGATLKPITYDMPNNSAQVKSAILLASLYATGKTTINFQGKSRDHTEKMLGAFGIPVDEKQNTLEIDTNNSLNATTINIPGDISSAAFIIVAATIIPNSKITIKDVSINATRSGIIEILTKMGGKIEISNKRIANNEEYADLYIESRPLTGIEIPIELIPLAIDEFPILFIAASMAKGKTILQNANELRLKESDRIKTMAEGLITLGINVISLQDGLIIEGGVLHGGEVDSFHDHRVAMAFLIAGACALAPVTVKNCDNISTSFPDFIELMNKIHLKIIQIK